MRQHCHILIARTAKEMAQAAYENLVQDNTFYQRYKDRRSSVRSMWPTLVPQARSMLTDMLARPDVSKHMKVEIYEALCLDNQLHPNVH